MIYSLLKYTTCGTLQTVFLIGTAAAIWLGIGAAMPIDKALTLGLF